MGGYKCFKCNTVVASSIYKLGCHYRRTHNMPLTGKDRREEFVCAQGNCQKTYYHFRSLRQHLLKNKCKNIEDITEDINLNSSSTSNFEIPDKTEFANKPFIFSSPENMKDVIAKMIIDLQGRSNVNFTVVKASIEACSNVVSSMTNILQNEVLLFMTKNNINADSEDSLRLLQKLEELSNPFNGLKTRTQQFKYYKKNFSFVEPKEIFLGSRIDQILDSVSQKYVTKAIPATCQYVSIIDKLTSILNNQIIFDHLMKGTTKSDNGILRTYSDGDIFLKHTFFQRYQNAFQLQLYYDDIETCNPLGSKSKIHELGAFYFTILNLPPEFNSTLNNIHLLSLCHSQDLQQYGFSAILRPFMDELKLLESDNGIAIRIGEKNVTLRASIAAVCADSLAAHALFGFLSPSAKHFCRLCLISREEMQSEFRSHKFIYRNKVQHQQYLQMSTKNDASSSGVREESILNESSFFHVTENFCFDAMHDLLEGVCPMEVKLVLNNLLYTESIDGLNVTLLNRRIHAFNYGLAERKNKPSANFSKAQIQNVKDHTLKQKAAQMWCLVRALPFLLFDKVQNNDYLHLLQLLLRIIEIVFAPSISRGLLCYLEDLCIEHHQKFKELFPDINLINKHHHMLHYADCMEKFGPLVRMWCMRYEAKHNYFKRHAAINCNFTNIAKTLANVHQLAQCSYWIIKGGRQSSIKLTSEQNVMISSCHSKVFLYTLGYSNTNIIKIAKVVEYNGIEYRPNLFMCINCSTGNNLLPTFGKNYRNGNCKGRASSVPADLGNHIFPSPSQCILY